MISTYRLRQLISYDSETGKFIWIQRRGGIIPGQRAGNVYRDGRRYINIDGRRYLASRLAWLHVYGRWPKEIDHLNRNRADDRLANLRDISHRENCLNRNTWSKSGVWGVRSRYGKWHAYATIHGKQVSLGWFCEREEAVRVATAKRRELYNGVVFFG